MMLTLCFAKTDSIKQFETLWFVIKCSYFTWKQKQVKQLGNIWIISIKSW